MILTGSEDTFLKLSLYKDQENTLEPMHTFSNHVGSIRSISKIYIGEDYAKSKQREYLILSAGSRM